MVQQKLIEAEALVEHLTSEHLNTLKAAISADCDSGMVVHIIGLLTTIGMKPEQIKRTLPLIERCMDTI